MSHYTNIPQTYSAPADIYRDEKVHCQPEQESGRPTVHVVFDTLNVTLEGLREDVMTLMKRLDPHVLRPTGCGVPDNKSMADAPFPCTSGLVGRIITAQSLADEIRRAVGSTIDRLDV